MSSVSPPTRRLVTYLWLCLAVVVAALLVLRAIESVRGPTVAMSAPVHETPVPLDETPPRPDLRPALEAALALPAPGQRAREFGRLLQRLADEDIETALAYVRQMPRDASYAQGLFIVLDRLSRRDEERALNLARELVTTREERAFYSSTFERIARHGIAAALARLPLVPEGEGLDKAVRAIADVWTPRDSVAAFTWASQLTGSARAAALESTLTILADTDPLKTIDYAQKSLVSPALERTVSHALQRLTRTDAKAAAALVQLLPPGEMQTFAALDVARALATDDPQGALDWIKSLPAGEAQRLALNNVLTVWGAGQTPGASQFVLNMVPGPAQDAAASHMAGVMAATNPSGALAWVQTLPSASARDAALISIASAWAQKDAPAATRWAGTLPESSLQLVALTGALSHWVLQDAQAAREHIATLPAATQAAAAGFAAPLLAQTAPEATLAWAQTLSDVAARDAALAAAFTRWLDNAPAAARAWLDASALLPETKARLASAPRR